MQQLQCECEEAQKERDSQSITASDMGREIDTLKKVPFNVVSVITGKLAERVGNDRP